MKELDPRIKRLVSSCGFDPESILVLRDANIERFSTVLEAEMEGSPKVFKITTDRRNMARLQAEANVLALAPRDYLSQSQITFPEIEGKLTRVEGLFAIVMSRVPDGEKPSFPELCHVLDVFQQMKIPKGFKAERRGPEDYRRKAFWRLHFLRKMGFITGLSNLEVRRIERFYNDNLEFLEPFDIVFVHGDFKPEHVKRVGEELEVFDFDKSAIGCELEDWAWLSVRYPWLSGKIWVHLRERFRGDEEKLKCLDRAFRLMQVDRLIEAYSTRTSQWRGDKRSYLQKIWGRLALQWYLLRP